MKVELPLGNDGETRVSSAMDLGLTSVQRDPWQVRQGSATSTQPSSGAMDAPVLGQRRTDSWEPSSDQPDPGQPAVYGQSADPGQLPLGTPAKAEEPGATSGTDPEEPAKQQEATELAARDREVRTHEAAHQAAGGGLAGSASFSYETSPDGKRYAVGGEVSIDMGSERDPAATIAKMQRVRAAALAPADPSPQDLAVASQASQIEAAARQQQREETAAKMNGGTQDGGPGGVSAKAGPVHAGPEKPDQARRAYAPAAAIGGNLDATA